MSSPSSCLTRCVTRLAALSFLAAPLAAGTVITVPGDFATIQAAIAGAAEGDTVLVGPGTYTETIDFLGKGIVVEGTGGAAVTIIDGQGVGPVVRFDSGEVDTSVLRGFTITGGNAATNGGGVLCSDTSPVVEECRITGNTAANGGGVAVVGSGADPLFRRCLIDHNTATPFFFEGGGGFSVFPGADARFIDCSIVANASPFGAGFFAWRGSLVLTGSIVRGNFGKGGLITTNLPVTLADCTFDANTGGGLSVSSFGDLFPGFIHISDCAFVRNTGDSGLELGTDGNADVSDCLLADNATPADGGAIHMLQGSLTIDHVTIANNSATSGSAIHHTSTSNDPLSITNSIIRGHAGLAIDTTETLTIATSNVEGGAPGLTNQDADPLFVDPSAGAYCLEPGSPSIGAGSFGSEQGFAPFGPWCDVGRALGSAVGIPRLAGSGDLTAESLVEITLTGGPPSGAAFFVIGASSLSAPFKGGVLVPALDFLVGGLPLDGNGDLAVGGRWPTGVPSGFTAWFQAWMPDASGLVGFGSTNGLAATAP